MVVCDNDHDEPEIPARRAFLRRVNAQEPHGVREIHAKSSTSRLSSIASSTRASWSASCQPTLKVSYVHIRQALNTDTGELKTPKTKAGVRKVKIEPNLMPLLRTMREEADGEGTVVPEMPCESEWASSLRRHLTLAGVRRSDLFANDKTRRWLTFHDLRHTGITWRAIRGDDAKKLHRSAGHSTQGQTDDYIAEAEVFGEVFGQVFPPLPAALEIESSPNRPVVTFQGSIPYELQRPQRESNPR